MCHSIYRCHIASPPPPPVDDDQSPLDTTNDDMDTTPGSVVTPTTETVSHNITEGTAPSDVLDIAPVSDQNPPMAPSTLLLTTAILILQWKKQATPQRPHPPTLPVMRKQRTLIQTVMYVLQLCSLLLTPQHPPECLANPEY